MKKYIYTGSGTLLVVENDSFDNFSTCHNHYGSIDWMWRIDEDGEFKFGNKTYQVKAGDIALCLYKRFKGKRIDITDGREIAIITNKEWYDIMAQEDKAEEECCSDCPCKCKSQAVSE